MLSSTQIIAYFLAEKRRTSINWTGIENKYIIKPNGMANKGRLKNCLYYPQKYKFTAIEIVQINKAIADLQVSDELF